MSASVKFGAKLWLGFSARFQGLCLGFCLALGLVPGLIDGTLVQGKRTVVPEFANFFIFASRDSADMTQERVRTRRQVLMQV